MRSIASFLVIAAVAYGVLVFLAWMFQGRLIHLPNVGGRELDATPADWGMDYADVWLQTDDGVAVHGWFVPGDGRAVLLFFHGNAGNISHRLDSLRQFRELGLDVLMIDYRGYGRSEGQPTEQGLYRDAQAAWQYLVDQRGVPSDRVIAFGRSLGGAVAAHLARQRPVRALILESTFTSAPAIGAEAYPFLPVRLLARYRYDALAAVRELTVPILVVHSRDDEIIPFRHGRRLYEAAPEPKDFLAISGSHNTGFLESEQVYSAGIDRFLAEVLGERERDGPRFGSSTSGHVE